MLFADLIIILLLKVKDCQYFLVYYLSQESTSVLEHSLSQLSI